MSSPGCDFCQTITVRAAAWSTHLSARCSDALHPLSSLLPVGVSAFTGFGMQDLPDGTRAAIELRALDAAAVLGNSVQVSLNGQSLPCRSFTDLVGMYEAANAKQPVFHFSTPAGWDIAVAAVPSSGHAHSLPLPIVNGGAHCLSYVNGMRTVRGGTHVAAVLNQVVPALADAAAKAVGADGSHAITPAMVKQHMRLYINAAVPNATFDSQAKEQCVTPATELQRAAKLPAKFLKQLTQDSGIVKQLAEAASAKYSAASSRAVKRALKENPLSGLPKLEDANWAGTRKGQQCTLILTEGDSAKALAVAGLAVVGRDQYGVFPLRGKVLNVRDLSPTAAVKNAEVAAIINILGLDFAKSYAGVAAADRGLRYGKVMIMTDQDHDGAHIKGLLINLFHTFWPELVEQGDFLEQFITPVIKARKGKQCHEFFSQRAFNEWCSQDSAWAGGKGWSVKYYKGLGTNTATEGRAYFKDLLKHRVPFEAGDAAEDSDRIQLAFSKQLADRRKDWLSAMQQAREQVLGMPAAADDKQGAPIGTAVAPDNALQPSLAAAGSSTYTQFIDEELIEFSRADLVRSIPSAVDGLKPSQRKVLHACFQRGASETKVAQLAGYVAERTAYHHGEASLISTIVGMAQDFVGSNNIPLLQAIGQFGTRLAGGKDAASARYIFTALAPIARLLFPAQDDGLLCHRVDDGQLVEPVAFVPVIPMALVNRSDGIGTGWSTSVPSHDPLRLVDDTLQWLQAGGQLLTRDQLPKQYDSQQPATWPWVRGFRGRIELGVPGKSFITRGVAGWVDEDVWWERAATRRSSKRGETDVSVLHITELPVGRWTDDFKAHLAQLKEKDQVLDFQDHHTDTAVDFLVKLSSHQADSIMTGKTSVDQLFKLATTLQVGNMHMFDAAGRIKRYRSPAEVQLEHRELRMRLYELRKARDELLAGAEAAKATSTAQFIDDVVHSRIQVMGRPYADVVATCAEKQYTNLRDLAAATKAQAQEAGIPDLALPSWVREGNANQATAADGFGYLLQLPLSQLTHEARGAAHASASKHQMKLQELQGTSASDLWTQELQALRVEVCKLQESGSERA